ncbi:MAG TPA: Gmad2 immunoglobulin-like domain-containing protein, partial [Candidatus Peribacteraceae bacterium]|nr:Gmad2 immunoglobulin-like domain-containing protein [Candidatus Peribacteraceae bacterium]
MQNRLPAILIGLVAAVVILSGAFYVACKDTGCGFMTVQAIDSFEECAAAGYPIMESYPRQCRVPGGQTYTEVIDEEVRAGNINVSSPAEHDVISSPVMITGEARVFENEFNYRVKDTDGTVLAEGHATALSPDMGLFGPFSIETEFDEPIGASGTIEVFNFSAKDGSEENMVIVPVEFGDGSQTMNVNVFFGHESADPNASCEDVFAVRRIVPKTSSVALAALQELVKGPTETEMDEAMFSSLPMGTSVKGLVINDGTARVTFDSKMKFVAGSCLVQAIRAQVERTLMQFPTV